MNDLNLNSAFACRCCGKVYEKIPLCFGTDYPYYYSIPTKERKRRVDMAESLCVIDERYFFHRGRITIPISNHPEDLIFNVWTSIGKENFELRNDLWNDPKRVGQEPYFGWLQTVIPSYGNTINIKTIARENKVGLTPNIEVIEEHHSLTYDQENGITYEVAVEKVQQILVKLHNE